MVSEPFEVNCALKVSFPLVAEGRDLSFLIIGGQHASRKEITANGDPI